jgi:hypothetical protein
MAYSGWYIPEDERARLLALFPTYYPDVYAHHITSELGLYDALAMPESVSAEIIGFADDEEGVQALVVRINGTTERPIGGTYHVTWSIDRSKGRKPVDSNRVIENQGWVPFVLAMPIKTEPRIFR